jgi:hypothetical protein
MTCGVIGYGTGREKFRLSGRAHHSTPAIERQGNPGNRENSGAARRHQGNGLSPPTASFSGMCEANPAAPLHFKFFAKS